MDLDKGKLTGYSWTAEIIINDHKGNIRRFTEKHVKRLEIVDE